MKKAIYFVVALVLCMASLTPIAMAAGDVPYTGDHSIGGAEYEHLYIYGDNLIYSIAQPENTVFIVYFGCKNTLDLVVPDEINGRPVTSFASYSSGTANLRSIKLPSGLEHMSRLSLPSGITSITIPASLQTVGISSSGMSWFTSDIEEMRFESGMRTMPSGMGFLADKLQRVYIPASVTNIDKGEFKYAKKLTMYGEKGSYAEKYAKANKITFVAQSGGDPAEVRPTKISLNKTTGSMTAGKTLKLKATISPKSAAGATVTWSSDNGAVATVNQDGTITAVGKGTTYIRVKTDNGKSAKCKVAVKLPKVSKVIIEATTYVINQGQSEIFYATVEPALANQKISWSSSNRRIVSVSKDGVIKGVKSGKATITAKASDGKKASCTVKVLPISNE